MAQDAAQTTQQTPSKHTPEQEPCGPGRDADSQRIQFEFAEIAANSFAVRIRCEFGLKFLVLRIRPEILSTANSGRIRAANLQATAK